MCPVKDKKYREFEQEFGEIKTLALWVKNGNSLPTIEEARKLLNSDQNQVTNNTKQIRYDIQTILNRTVSEGQPEDLIRTASSVIKRVEENSGVSEGTRPEMGEYQSNSNKLYQLTNNTNKLKYELQQRIKNAESGNDSSTIASALRISRTIKETGKGNGEIYAGTSRLQEREIPQRVGRIVEQSELGTKQFEGKEYEVYFSNDGKNVFKVNKIANGDFDEFFKSLLIHNYFFPETKYELVGFIKKENNYLPVLKQSMIKENTNYNYRIITNKLTTLGFTEINSGQFKNNKLGIGIFDLDPYNVKFVDGKPYFIDPVIYIHPSFYETVKEKKINKPINQKLNDKIGEFLRNAGVSVQQVDSIQTADGYSAKAVVDTINKTIQIVNEGADIDTLPEEAAHIYVDLLPANSMLLKNLIAGIKGTQLYEDTLKEYTGDPEYMLPSGDVNEDKMAKEAIGKMIAMAVVDQFENNKVKNLWEKLWDYIKSLFTGATELNPYQTAASDILAGNTGGLDTNQQGSGIYYQLSPEEEQLAKNAFKKATPLQAKVIDEVFYKPHARVSLDKGTEADPRHDYIDLATGEIMESVTTAIGNDFPEELQGDYEDNRNWGNDIDRLMQGICLKQEMYEIETPYISDNVKAQAFGILREYYGQLSADGSIVIPQVIVADPQSKTAGSIDLLVIDPFGNMKIVDIKSSWNSSKGSSFRTPNFIKADSRITKAININVLNKNQTHGIQIGSYAKMLELQGWYISGLATKHLYIKVDNKVDRNIQKVVDEGEINRRPSDNKNLIDAIIPTPLTNKDRLQEINDEFKIGNPVRSKQFQEALTEDVPENIEQVMTDKLKEIEDAHKKFQKQLDDLTNTSGTRNIRDAAGLLKTVSRFEPRDKFTERMNEIAAIIEAAKTHDSQSAAYTEFLKFVKTEVTNISKYLTTMETVDGITTPKNINDPNYINIANLANKYIDTFHGIMDLNVYNNAAQAKLLTETVQALNDTKKDIVTAERAFVKNMVKDNTSRKALTDEVLESLITLQKDISANALYFDNPRDTGVAVIDNGYKVLNDKILIAKERAEELINDHIVPAAEKLRIANGGKKDPKMFNFMLRKDRNGKQMGQIVSQIGRVYREKQDKILSALTDVNGKVLQYKNINNSETATDEDVNSNIALWYKKEARKNFINAETIEVTTDGDPILKEGDYHRYSEEFLAEREKNMYLDKRFKKGGGIYYVWEFYGGSNKEQEASVVAFKRKYFDQVDNYLKMTLDSEGRPTGIVTEVTGSWFPKPQYIEPRERSAFGDLLADPEYYKLMHPTTPLEIAQKEFYEMYTTIMPELLSMLPASRTEMFKKGGIVPLGASWIQQLSNGDVNVGKLLAGAYQALYETPVEMSQDVAAMAGSRLQSLPLLYMTPLQSQLQLDKIAAERAKLQADRAKYSDADYQAKLAELDNLDKKERKKMTAADIYPDLALGLIELTKVATQFQAKVDAESTLIAIKSHLVNMQFEQQSRFLDKVTGKRLVPGEQSNAYKRWSEFLDMAFYNDPLMDRNTLDIVTKKLMGITSAIGLGFNVFAWTNNVISGTINNTIDSIGSDLFDRSALRRMRTTEMPKLVRGMMLTKMAEIGHSSYEGKKDGSQLEAMCDLYHAIEHYEAPIRGQTAILSKLGMYGGTEAGEYMMQAQVAGAILGSIPVKNSITGETAMLYDCYVFDPETGKVKLLEGFEVSDKERHDISLRIRATIDRIHGNYTPMNKTVFEKQWWGALIMQFHKWVYPNFKQRAESKKYNENLGGGMDIEGRYRTLWNFVKGLNSISDIPSGAAWNKLTDHQKANIQKDIADAVALCVIFAIGHVIKSIADGIPDDDPELKRFVHWAQQQTDRTFQETSLFVPLIGLVEGYQLLKSPVAGAGSIKEFAQLLQSSYQYPFIDDEHRYYQRGVYAGQSHLAKEARDIVPIMKEWNRIQSLLTVSTFYIN